MAKYKYQIGLFNLFDYAGVERHLEKMAAKGWLLPYDGAHNGIIPISDYLLS